MKKIIFHPIVVWGITIAVFLLFLWAGMTKLLAPETYADVWNNWGIPSIFVYIVGILEISGAMAILNPRLAAIPALALTILMVIAASLCFKNNAPGPGWTAVIALGLAFCLSLLRRRDLFYKNRE
jgi:uncharacterized membrane protein YphA (DoxX/SURF4 family)